MAKNIRVENLPYSINQTYQDLLSEENIKSCEYIQHEKAQFCIKEEAENSDNSLRLSQHFLKEDISTVNNKQDCENRAVYSYLESNNIRSTFISKINSNCYTQASSSQSLDQVDLNQTKLSDILQSQDINGFDSSLDLFSNSADLPTIILKDNKAYQITDSDHSRNYINIKRLFDKQTEIANQQIQAEYSLSQDDYFNSGNHLLENPFRVEMSREYRKQSIQEWEAVESIFINDLLQNQKNIPNIFDKKDSTSNQATRSQSDDGSFFDDLTFSALSSISTQSLAFMENLDYSASIQNKEPSGNAEIQNPTLLNDNREMLNQHKLVEAFTNGFQQESLHMHDLDGFYKKITFIKNENGRKNDQNNTFPDLQALHNDQFNINTIMEDYNHQDHFNGSIEASHQQIQDEVQSSQIRVMIKDVQIVDDQTNQVNSPKSQSELINKSKLMQRKKLIGLKYLKN
eukprot:403369074